ncbi:MAG TPA: dicarboxylate/amino acid:cation symporter [Steroidobacteraceae bacterium]|nr:dicarboxylate/amino acid:cation symporter [Steroidobacteraceae bacterium]
MSLSTRVVISLAAGLGLGILLAALNKPTLSEFAANLEPIGTLWLNALRMTVVPLVVALLITGVASASETAGTGKLAARSLLVFIVFLTGAATISALVMPAALAAWPVDPQAAEALRAGATSATVRIPELPPLREWFENIVPTNPFGALAEGAMLPLVVFSLLFGFAASHIAAPLREALLSFLNAVIETMFVLVRWILVVAPIGIFVLALGVGLRGGIGAAGALAHYLLLLCALCIFVTLLFYPLAAFGLRIPLRHFAQALAPAQVVAFSTQSSLASLPAMIERSNSHLRVPPRVTAIVLPLAVSLFRVTSPPMNLAIVLFVAHIYGVPIELPQLIAGLVVAVITSFAVVGLPGQATFFTTTVPISLTMGVPMELLALLLAVEVIPDIFRTVGNVTADMTVNAMLGRNTAAEPAAVREGAQ